MSLLKTYVEASDATTGAEVKFSTILTSKGDPLMTSLLNVTLTVWVPKEVGLKVTKNLADPDSS